jgi:hypothetical protein
MRFTSVAVCVALFALAGVARASSSADDLKKEVEKLRKEIAQKQESRAAINGRVDALVGGKYGPNTAVTTKSGKLQIGGLLQVWYQSPQKDKRGLFVPGPGNGLGNDPTDFTTLEETNSPHNNDTFRVRRTELNFYAEIHENVSAFVLVDPARESNLYFVPVPTFQLHNERFHNPVEAASLGGPKINPQLLQDAYINFHGVVPHHDFTVGQFIPPVGEEAWRSSGMLEFVERAMVTAENKVRDIGVMMHGTWVDNRVQYWVGAFNGPDATVVTDPEIYEGGNRSDDNSDKDIAWRVAVRPVWNKDAWYGRLELGYARTDGYRGKNDTVDRTAPTNDLNSVRTAINRQVAWGWYRPGDKVKGMWLRGEWGSSHDRYSLFRQPTASLGSGGFTDDPYFAGLPEQLNPTPVVVTGWYLGTGYKLSDSIFAEDLKGGDSFQKFLYDLEFAFRAEAFHNVAIEDPAAPDRHTELFNTYAYTAGVNYFIKGHDVKLQANYIFVRNPHDANLGLHNMRNNVFVVAFQVMF